MRGRWANRWTYLFAAAVLLAVEVAIALLVPGGFVRQHLGDVLVVILLYCLVRGLFPRLPPTTVAVCVLLFAAGVEAAQAADLVGRLGLQQNAVARTVIGTAFDWRDLVAYTAGVVVALMVDTAGPAGNGRASTRSSKLVL